MRRSSTMRRSSYFDAHHVNLTIGDYVAGLVIAAAREAWYDEDVYPTLPESFCGDTVAANRAWYAEHDWSIA